MRLPRIRFTVRQLMVVVAVVSLLLAVTTGLLRRRASFQRRTEVHARKASQENLMGMFAGELPYNASARLTPMQERTRDAHYELAGYYYGLEAKYRRAAGRPWLPIGTDPPPPAWPRGVPSAFPDKVRQLRNQGLSVAEIAKALAVSDRTVFRYLVDEVPVPR
jgi:hypothetical protein